jgi:uncharacterized protein YndB with AHSA1/START domain
MTVQAHRINIQTSQQSVFEALSTAQGWSRWFTPEVTGGFAEGSEVVCQPNGRTPIRLRVTSVKPESAIAFEILEGPFAVPGQRRRSSWRAPASGRRSACGTTRRRYRKRT